MTDKKRNNLWQSIILLLLGVLVVVLAFLSSDVSLFTRKSKPPQISIIMRETDSAVWSNIRIGMEQASYDLGCEIRYLTVEESNHIEQQNSLLQREVEVGTNAFVVMPADSEKMAQTIKQLNIKVPVIALETPLENNALFVGQDNKAIGETLAQACENAPQPIVLLQTTGENNGVYQRLQACKKVLQQQGKEVIVQEVNIAQLAIQLPVILQQTGAKTIIAFEPSATDSISQHNQTDAEIYGVGSTKNIISNLENSTIEAIVAWSDYAVGYLAVQTAYQAVQKNAIEPTVGSMSYRLIKRTEIYEEDNQKLLFPVIG